MSQACLENSEWPTMIWRIGRAVGPSETCSFYAGFSMTFDRFTARLRNNSQKDRSKSQPIDVPETGFLAGTWSEWQPSAMVNTEVLDSLTAWLPEGVTLFLFLVFSHSESILHNSWNDCCSDHSVALNLYTVLILERTWLRWQAASTPMPLGYNVAVKKSDPRYHSTDADVVQGCLASMWEWSSDAWNRWYCISRATWLLQSNQRWLVNYIPM